MGYELLDSAREAEESGLAAPQLLPVERLCQEGEEESGKKAI